MARTSLLALALQGVAACAAPSTWAEVVVDASDDVRAGSSELEVLVLSDPGATVLFHDTAKVPADVDWPVTLILAPGASASERFHVIARAGTDGVLVARQLLLGGYAPGEAVVYTMRLELEEPSP